MVDLETLGTQPYAPLLSIGAVAFTFDDEPILDVFYQPITLESCLELGMRADAGAIEFWMEQSQEAREVFRTGGRVKLPNALDAFTDWWGSRPMYLWGNSARFDCGLLEAAYKACRKEIPWEWWKERCYRTVKGLPGAGLKLVRHGTHHNALDDALSQALHLRELYKKLGFKHELNEVLK